MRETGETATLSAPGEHDAVTVDFAHGSAAVQSVAQLGRPSIGHATAVGQGAARLRARRAPAPPLDRRSPPGRSPTRSGSPRSSTGYAGGASPRPGTSARRGSSAIAAPVRDSRGELVGILGVQGPSSRFDARAAQSGSAAPARPRVGTLSPAGSAAVTAQARREAASPASQPDEAGGAGADLLRELRVGAPLHSRPVGADDEQARRAARRRARAAPRSAAGCTAAAVRPRPPGAFASAAGSRSASSTSCVPTYSYPIASEIGPSGTSAALTMISGCPDSTAVSTASAVASGSKGTSNVTSITGWEPSRAAATSAEVRRRPTTRITRVGAPSSASA